MIRAKSLATWLIGICLLLATGQAEAALTLCNRTSYLMDVAIGLEKRPNVSTRGWFRVKPGRCRAIIDAAPDAGLIYMYARTLPLYGTAPLPQGGHAELCIRPTDFQIANARGCPLSQKARFTATRPADGDDGPVVNLAEQADYDDAQARLAAIQRLLVIAGYDARPIDGVDGAKTQAALAAFVKDRGLPADAASKEGFFATLLEAAHKPEGHGFAWCNDTAYSVMASLGIVEMGSIITRGWYRVAAGQCVRPALRGKPRKVYSYAEAVDGSGRTVKRGGAPLAWGGEVMLCTRDGKFELGDHKDCASRGLNSAGFAAIDTGDKPSITVRFREP